jgi:bacteriocin biosynthesis cyclodehydratase domain-containing protein
VQQLSGESGDRGPLHVPERPLLAPWLRRAATPGRILLEYADSIFVLEGRSAELLLPAMLPLLDGSRSTDDLVAEIGEEVRPAVEHALEELAGGGALVEGPAVADADALSAAATSVPPIAPALAAARLQAGRVIVVGAGETAAALAGLFDGVVGDVGHVGWDDEHAIGRADLAVAAPSPAELPLLAAWNERMLDARRAWIQALPPNGRFAAIGPLYLPGETCCYACYTYRRASALGAGEELAALELAPASYPVDRMLATATAALAGSVALRWLTAADPTLPGALFALELEDGLHVERHRVFRVPRCNACSGALDVAPALPWAEELAS